MKKIILTGATGLIGKEAIYFLESAGYKVYCIRSNECNIFDYDSISNLFSKIKPEYLLHFAWFTGEGYLEDSINQKFVDASMNMLEQFKNNGGRKAVFAGTCFEYKFQDKPLKETDETEPQTLYAKSKIKLYKLATEYCNKNSIDFGWGRIFYVYGHEENEKRLTPYIINNLKNNKPVEIKCGQLIRDYMYTKDIAHAFVQFLDSNVTGIVNICKGKGTSLGEYAKIIAKELGKEYLLTIKTEKTNQPQIILGDNSILTNQIGFKNFTSLENIVNKLIYNE